MVRIAMGTVRERWPLFIGSILVVALGVALVESGVLVTMAAARLSGSPEIEAAREGIYSVMGLTLTISTFLSILVIGSCSTFSVNERTKDFALLRVCGATPRQISRILLGEGLITGVIGATLGVLAGFPLTPVQALLLSRLGLPGESLDPSPSLLVIVPCALGGVAVSLLGVNAARRRTSRIDPLAMVRNVEQAARVMTVGRWCAAAVWIVATGATMLTMSVISDATGTLALSLLVIFSATLALQALCPLLVPATARLGRLVLPPSATSTLALGNLVDNRRRAATVSGPVIALTGIVLGLFAVTQTTSEATRISMIEGTRAQLVVEAPARDAERIAQTAGVEAAASLVLLPADFRMDGHPYEGRVLATDPAAYRAVMSPRMKEGDLRDFTDGTAVIPDESRHVTSGGRIRVGLPGADTRDYPIAAQTRTAPSDSHTVVLPIHDVEAHIPGSAQALVMVRTTAAEPAQVARELRDRGFTVRTVTAWAADQAAEADTTNRWVILSLAGMGGFYALLAVINSMILTSLSRKREFAVQRLSGLTRSQVVRTCLLEGAGLTVTGFGLGLVATALCLAGLRRGFAIMVGEPVMVLPWGAMAILALVLVVAVQTATAASAWVATRPRAIRLAAQRE